MTDLRTDTLVVGSGIAGLFTALQASRLGSVVLVTKSALEESNTRYAQGGIAAVMFDDDETELHVADTIAAGAGLCDEDAVRVLCTEGPDRIRDLIQIGVAFDRNGAELARGLEAAHSRSRVLHAGGDATGAMVEAGLAAAIREANITILEQTFLVDLITGEGSISGAHFLDASGLPVSVHASAVVLATGGAGQVYQHTTNPLVATGDGAAAAFRAGAAITDPEFFQFHPTALALPDTFLISEAVRGEGAVLINAEGERFMQALDHRGDLAPRDVVARGIANEMAKRDGAAVCLDATSLGASFLATRFPSIDKYTKDAGLDWATQPIPVTPAAHYWMGGVHTDTSGRTTLDNLYAVGEVASTGVHGANRLASNSLLEGLVFGARAVKSISEAQGGASRLDDAMVLRDAAQSQRTPSRSEIQSTMWNNVGLSRDRSGLDVALKQLSHTPTTPTTKSELEDQNLATVGRLIAHAALSRWESRGAHYRSDYSTTEPSWQHHQHFVRA